MLLMTMANTNLWQRTNIPSFSSAQLEFSFYFKGQKALIFVFQTWQLKAERNLLINGGKQ